MCKDARPCLRGGERGGAARTSEVGSEGHQGHWGQGGVRLSAGLGRGTAHNSHPSKPLTGLHQVENRVATALSQVLGGRGGLPRVRGVLSNPCTVSSVNTTSRSQGEDPGLREESASIPRADSSPEGGNAVYQAPPFCQGALAAPMPGRCAVAGLMEKDMELHVGDSPSHATRGLRPQPQALRWQSSFSALRSANCSPSAGLLDPCLPVRTALPCFTLTVTSE